LKHQSNISLNDPVILTKTVQIQEKPIQQSCEKNEHILEKNQLRTIQSNGKLNNPLFLVTLMKCDPIPSKTIKSTAVKVFHEAPNGASFLVSWV
jgi:hypothetical protein